MTNLSKQQRCSRCEKGEGRTHDGFHPVGVGRYARCGLLPPYDEQEAPFPSNEQSLPQFDDLPDDVLAELSRKELFAECVRLRNQRIQRSAVETSGEWVRLDHDTIEQNQPVLMRRTGSPQIPMWQMWRSRSAQETSEQT